MLEVVFDDSSKGSMKMAKNYNAKGMADGATSVFYVNDKPSKKEQKRELKEFRAKMEKEWAEGKPVGGSPQDVVCIGFALDIGDIACDIDSKQQKNKYAKVFEHIPAYRNDFRQISPWYR